MFEKCRLQKQNPLLPGIFHGRHPCHRALTHQLQKVSLLKITCPSTKLGFFSKVSKTMLKKVEIP
jgi:hypothetical protein